ncbi:hypothetical protein GX48_01983 [Paracoccidioides brasiliensis]|nr:hypothetical protein GX48_01983 [Paracoccidioides brasiliensis]
MADKNSPGSPRWNLLLRQLVEASSRPSNSFASDYNLPKTSAVNNPFPEAKDREPDVSTRLGQSSSDEYPTPRSSLPTPSRQFPQSQGPADEAKGSSLPQPIDSSTCSSMDKEQQINNLEDLGNSSPKRKFVPEPIETSSRSSRHRHPPSKSTGRVAPQLLETTSDRRRHQKVQGSNPRNLFENPPDNGAGDGETKVSPSPGNHMHSHINIPIRSGVSPSSSESPRRFSPQLIDTATRSVRQKCLARGRAEGHDRRQASPFLASQQKLSAPESTESRFSYANILRRQEAKKHSFLVPALSAIPSISSEGSEKSRTHSPPTSPSTLSNNSSNKYHKERRLLFESCDDRYSGYLRSLAERSVKQMLRDQALAAFPNEQVYHPVSHFAIGREDEDTTDDDDALEISLRNMTIDFLKFRRESTIDLGWELDEMRSHKEESEMRARQRMFDSGQSRFSAAAIAARQAAESEVIRAHITGHQGGVDVWQKRLGLDQMKSPPLLGGDIVFPLGISPQTTRCDVDHHPVPHHDDNCSDLVQREGLWNPEPNAHDSDEGGLWMGLCRRTGYAGRSPSSLPRAGIITPTSTMETTPFHFQSPNSLPIAKAITYTIPPDSPSRLPSTPPPSSPDLDNVDKLLILEQGIKREFNDAFVTQIYNYLSLGYPCLARDYDEELSKISRIPIEELRKDDRRANAKGYVGAPEGVGVGENEVVSGQCMRWTALRLYIHEWARQQPWMAMADRCHQANPSGMDAMDAWGAGARRGSWAI